MKNIHWKTVMILALILMFSGFGVSLWGYFAHNLGLLISGFLTIVVVCASWWFWVMFVIHTILKYSQSTTNNLGEIKIGIREVKRILRNE